MKEEESKIFISYSRKDKDFALRLAEDLRAAGVEIWIDQLDIPPGVRWDDAVEDALDLCKYFMVILSPVSVESKDVKDEIAYALDAGKKIIPVFYKECKIPLRIRRLNYIDFTSDYNSGKTKIIEAMKKDQTLQTEPQIVKEEKPKEVKKVVKTPPKKAVPKPEIIRPKTTVFRSNAKELSVADVKSMLKKHSFFEVEWNKNGKGFYNKFEVKTITGDKVVFDSASELMWQQSGSDESMDYENAKKWIAKLNEKGYAGYKDWRLPTLEEAMSLMEREVKNDLYINPVFDSEQRWIWTADQVKGESWAWVVGFGLGNCGDRGFYGYYGYVRAVRSGQSSAE